MRNINKSNLNTGRRKSKYISRFLPRTKYDRIGIPTGLLDMDGNEIKTGDTVRFSGYYDDGIVLYHRGCKAYGLFFGLWYGEKDPYDADCYGKFIRIPADNGMRMELKIL